MELIFKNREEVGKKLAKRLSPLKEREPIVLALPRGGVPVAHEIAKELAAPLEVFVVKKIGAPENPEFAIGAVAEDAESTEKVVHEIQRQVNLFRNGRPPIVVRNRSVILVDDGMATGWTMLAAVRSIRRQGASYITVAVPVSSISAMNTVSAEVDEVHCLLVPEDLSSVGEWYEDFLPVSDQEVIQILAGYECSQ